MSFPTGTIPPILIQSVRTRVADLEKLRSAFKVQCSDVDATDATVTVTSSSISGKVTDGTTANDFDLDYEDYPELYQLVNAINDLDGWDCVLSDILSPRHSPTDLAPVTDMECLRVFATVNALHQYPDAVYELALNESLTEHNPAYTDWALLPEKEYYLIDWLATMQMCLIRATEANVKGQSTSSDTSSGSYSIGLGDLSISESGPGVSLKTEEGVGSSEDWLNIYEKYKAKYAAETGIDDTKDTDHLTVEIQQAELYRYEFETTQKSPLSIAPKATAPVIAIKKVSTNSVTISVVPCPDYDFYYYKLFKGLASDVDFKTGEFLLQIWNQREEEITLNDLTEGDLFYLVLYSYNTNTKQREETILEGIYPAASNILKVQMAWQAPIFTDIVPNSGAAGITVNIIGEHFREGAEVKFGVEQAEVTFISDILLEAKVPNGTGVVDVTVTNDDDQSATITGAFTYA